MFSGVYFQGNWMIIALTILILFMTDKHFQTEWPWNTCHNESPVSFKNLICYKIIYTQSDKNFNTKINIIKHLDINKSLNGQEMYQLLVGFNLTRQNL